jgi:hypothetical protein
MLLILILIGWLAITLLIVALCHAAARGDRRAVTVDDHDSPVQLRPGLLVWEQRVVAITSDAPARRVLNTRRMRVHRPVGARRRSRSRDARVAAHGLD